MIFIILIFFVADCFATNCVNDAQCTPFQFCSAGVCVADNRGCPGGCLPAQVCVPPNCVANPLIPTTTTIARARCPTGWIFNAMFNSCYLVGQPVRNQYTYTTARTICVANGGLPASIRSAAESQFIGSILGTVAYWIGLIRVGNTYRWEDGSPITFINWRGSQPDNCCPGGQATCTLVNYANFNGFWDDAGCNQQWRPHQNYICKRAPM